MRICFARGIAYFRGRIGSLYLFLGEHNVFVFVSASMYFMLKERGTYLCRECRYVYALYWPYLFFVLFVNVGFNLRRESQYLFATP